MLTKEPKDFAHKQQVKQASTVLEPSISFPKLVKLVDAEKFTNEKLPNLDLPLEIIKTTSKRDSQISSETCDPISECMTTRATDPKHKSKPQFRKYCSFLS